MLRNIEETLSTSCALHKNREIIYLQGDFRNEKKKKKNFSSVLRRIKYWMNFELNVVISYR